jgi:type I restriction enzyme M protein
MIEFEQKTKTLIDALKGICASNGLGNNGNEYKVIIQSFLYKFLNDRFIYEIKKIDKKFQKNVDFEKEYRQLNEDKQKMLLAQLPPQIAVLKSEHLISNLYKQQRENNFSNLFDDTLKDIALINNDIFSVVTDSGSKIILFDEISKIIIDPSKRDNFCRALINQLVGFTFENVFDEKFDFFSSIFEYIIKDYNKDTGGMYAEYYTPYAVSKIISKILIPDTQKNKLKNISCYDPSAGSGSLLMSLSHEIGEKRCSIFSQDISQKSSDLLRLNLIINSLVHSIKNIIQGNTILHPFHKDNNELKKFDYIVSNPPFKMNFSDYREELFNEDNQQRFFAGIQNVPPKKKDNMPIYQLFLQHILFSLNHKGKAAIVVPTGFLTAGGIDEKIRKYIIENKILSGVVTLPSDIFASTGTNVSIIFIDKENNKHPVLVDASLLGVTIKQGKNKKTFLKKEDENKIINAFNSLENIEDFSAIIPFQEFENKNYSFSAGQYFLVNIKYEDISDKEFKIKLEEHKKNIKEFSEKAKDIEKSIYVGIEKIDNEYIKKI